MPAAQPSLLLFNKESASANTAPPPSQTKAAPQPSAASVSGAHPGAAERLVSQERLEARRMADALLSGVSGIDALLAATSMKASSPPPTDPPPKQPEAAAARPEEKMEEPWIVWPWQRQPVPMDQEQRKLESEPALAEEGTAVDAAGALPSSPKKLDPTASPPPPLRPNTPPSAQARSVHTSSSSPPPVPSVTPGSDVYNRREGSRSAIGAAVAASSRTSSPVKAAGRTPGSSQRRKPTMRPGASELEILSTALAAGVERAFEAELIGGCEASSSLLGGTCGGESGGGGWVSGGGGGADSQTSAIVLRDQLLALLGQHAFEAAHARLLAAAYGDESEDDALAGGEVQSLLGTHYKETLPQMLRLIFIEAALPVS